MIKATARLAAVAVGALLLAGCSGGSEEPATPAATPTSVAPTADDRLGNLDDPLCAAAQESIETSTQLQAKATELTDVLKDPSFLASPDATELNAWGEEVVDLSNETLDFYKMGVAETAGDDVNADFMAMVHFVTSYTLPLAEAASTAPSTAEFFASVQSIVTDPEARAAASDAPAAAVRVAAYLGTRCGLAG